MRRTPGKMILAAAMCLALPSAALASGTIECTGVEDPNVTAFVSIGRLPILAVLSAQFSADGRVWATDVNGGGEGMAEKTTAIIFGQGYADGRQTFADFTDPNVEQILVSLRLVNASDETDDAEAGLLVIPGAGIWPVVCING